MLSNRNDEGGYKPGEVVPFPTRPWPSPQTLPCYLPQRYDRAAIQELEMGPIGPWASGQVDRKTSGLTGTRPVVDKYSITKYSTQEWRRHNAITLQDDPIRNADRLEVDAKNCLMRSYATADKEFNCNTDLLKDRAQDIYRWKCETEYCIKSMTDEIFTLEELRQRFKRALSILLLPESIAKECLDLRSNRLESDLVSDTAEEELIKELSLIAEIRRLFEKNLADIEDQLKSNKALKARVEFDWSDKLISYDTETLNVGLNNKSSIVLMKPGSVRVPNEQSTLYSWEQFCKDNLEQAEESRQQSIRMRKFFEVVLLNTARDLRTQAERADQSLAEKATCTDELRIRLEDELKKTLQKLVRIENLCEELRQALRRMDLSMKVAQTRLDNRCIIGRPNVENCRDAPQCGLIEEIKSIIECIQSLEQKLHDANKSRVELLKNRGVLEREIMVKKKSLSIDRERCPAVRSFYPSASKISGHD